MDDALVLVKCYLAMLRLTVLILVVMDDALVRGVTCSKLMLFIMS